MNPSTTGTDTARERLDRLAGYIAHDPGNRTLVLEAGRLALELGCPGQALAWVDHLLDTVPGDRPLTALKASLCLGLGRPADAEAILESLIAQEDDNPVLRYNLAWARTQNGNPAAAFEDLERITPEARDGLPRYWVLRAQAAYHRQAFDEALAAIDHFLASSPDDVEALNLRSLMLLDSGASTEAGAAAQVLLARNPDSEVARLVLGTLALERREADETERWLRPVTQSSALGGRAWSALGFAALLRQQPEDAENCFLEAVKTMPNHLGTWHGLAWVRIMRGNLDGARQAVERAMRVNRSFADNHGTLGVIDAMQNRLTEAGLSVRRALRLNPGSAAALYAKSLILAKSGDVHGSEELIGRILDRRSMPNAQSIAHIMAEQAGRTRH